MNADDGFLREWNNILRLKQSIKFEINFSPALKIINGKWEFQCRCSTREMMNYWWIFTSTTTRILAHNSCIYFNLKHLPCVMYFFVVEKLGGGNFNTFHVKMTGGKKKCLGENLLRYLRMFDEFLMKLDVNLHGDKVDIYGSCCNNFEWLILWIE